MSLGIMLLCGMLSLSHSAGMLTPKGAGYQPVQIRDHHVNVVINNGFAMTEVTQTFYNPNDHALEAVYSFPLPQHASLAEVTIFAGEKEIHGEVLPKQQAEQVYREERHKGNDTGLAQKRGFQAFDFAVSPVPAKGETRIRFVYYQPLRLDTGIGRYLYPLQDGGTDDAGASFWTTNTKVDNTFSLNLTLKSAHPVVDVRTPGFETAATITKVNEGHYTLNMQLQDVRLERDFIFYYRLQDNLPGRIEVLPYRPNENSPGTFMLVVTPGIDLQPLNRGADYTFVLDVSGSMQGKIATLARGVIKALGTMRPEDRVRVITFNHQATDVTRGWIPTTPDNVAQLVRQVEALQATGSTNLYAGLELALSKLDDDRATSIVLVTDGVTNTGIIEPREFHRLMQRYDVRVFGFLMGNSANWPLMRTITDTSGGFYAAVSNDDDIIGQIMLAKSKVTVEALHNVSLKITGMSVTEVTDDVFAKVYRGQQLVIFGRYTKAGEARVTLKARLTGEDRAYTTTFTFPAVDTESPELERLWALARIEQLEAQSFIGALPSTEMEGMIRHLGVTYQLVTDYTSMVVLADAAFAERGIERRNQARVAQERQAQAVRAQQPARPLRVDHSSPAFTQPAPSVGGGAIDPLTGGMALSLAGLAAAAMARRRTQCGPQA
jgi:Ca-activated chloride channel family protein